MSSAYTDIDVDKIARPSPQPRKATASGPILSAPAGAAIRFSSIRATCGNRCFTAFRPAAIWHRFGKASPPSIRPARRSNGASKPMVAGRSPLPPSTAGSSARSRRIPTRKSKFWSSRRSGRSASATAAPSAWCSPPAIPRPTRRRARSPTSRRGIFVCGADERVVVERPDAGLQPQRELIYVRASCLRCDRLDDHLLGVSRRRASRRS